VVYGRVDRKLALIDSGIFRPIQVRAASFEVRWWKTKFILDAIDTRSFGEKRACPVKPG